MEYSTIFSNQFSVFFYKSIRIHENQLFFFSYTIGKLKNITYTFIIWYANFF